MKKESGREEPDIKLALINWFKTQDISAPQGCIVMLHMVGELVAMGAKDFADWTEAIAAAQNSLLVSSAISYDEKHNLK